MPSNPTFKTPDHRILWNWNKGRTFVVMLVCAWSSPLNRWSHPSFMNCKVYNSTNAGKNKPNFQFFSYFCTIPVSKSLNQCCVSFCFIFEHVLAKNATYSRYILAASNPPYAKSIHTRLYLVHMQLLIIHTRLHLTHNRLHFFPRNYTSPALGYISSHEDTSHPH